MNLVTRLTAPGKLSLEQYLKLPVGSEIILWGWWPIEFMEKDLGLRIARDRHYKIRRVERHWTREMMRNK